MNFQLELGNSLLRINRISKSNFVDERSYSKMKVHVRIIIRSFNANARGRERNPRNGNANASANDGKLARIDSKNIVKMRIIIQIYYRLSTYHIQIHV